MATGEKYLRPMLDSGSSRVFNLLDNTLRLRQQAAKLAGNPKAEPDRLFFKTRKANNLVLLKYTPTDQERDTLHDARPVQTKLYLAFNERNIYEGGKTVLVTDPALDAVLAEHLAVSPELNADQYYHDRNLLELLDGLPSLDPFLIRDKLEIEAIAVNESYLDIPATELAAIKAFVREKMTAVASFAMQNQPVQDSTLAVDRLTQKLWEAKDSDALKPVIDAFRIDPAEAPAIVYAWKGTIYFDYDFHRHEAKWKRVGDWLATAAPRETGFGSQANEIERLRSEAQHMRSRTWLQVSGLLQKYHQGFDALFVSQTKGGDFIDFLKNSRETFWALGDGLSRLSHSHNVWDRSTERFPLRKLPAPQLIELLDAIRRLHA
jgi:hypothetical protein